MAMAVVTYMPEHYINDYKGVLTDDRSADNMNHYVQALEQFLASVRRFSRPGAVHGPVTRLRTDTAMEWHIIYMHMNMNDILKLLQTTTNMKITLINAKGVPHSLWYTAYKYAACLINGCTNIINAGVMPNEENYKKKPVLSTLLAEDGVDYEALDPRPTYKLASRTKTDFQQTTQEILDYQEIGNCDFLDYKTKKKCKMKTEEKEESDCSENKLGIQISQNILNDSNEQYILLNFETSTIKLYDINNGINEGIKDGIIIHLLKCERIYLLSTNSEKLD